MKVYIVMCDRGIVRKVTTSKQVAREELKAWANEIENESKSDWHESRVVEWYGEDCFGWDDQILDDYISFTIEEHDVEE